MSERGEGGGRRGRERQFTFSEQCLPRERGREKWRERVKRAGKAVEGISSTMQGREGNVSGWTACCWSPILKGGIHSVLYHHFGGWIYLWTIRWTLLLQRNTVVVGSHSNREAIYCGIIWWKAVNFRMETWTRLGIHSLLRVEHCIVYQLYDSMFWPYFNLLTLQAVLDHQPMQQRTLSSQRISVLFLQGFKVGFFLRNKIKQKFDHISSIGPC